MNNSILRAHIEKRSFHHGYLLVGDFDALREMTKEAAQAILGKIEAHPDFFYQKYEFFRIEDSHEIRRRASMKPFIGANKVFVLEILSIGVEAGNALLKLFEEPYEGTYFFVIASSLDEIIPTLRSRLTIVNYFPKNFEPNEEKKIFYKEFLSNLPNKRMEMAKKFFEDKQRTIEFLNEIEVVVHNKLSDFLILGKIQECRNFLYQKGGSAKMVLEYLALTLPQM